MDDCIFCKVIAGELPSSTLYEDDVVLAFLDINPVNPGHALIVPKKHYTAALETPDDVLKALFQTAKKVAPAVGASLGAGGFNLTFNNGSIAGQVVHHTHLHVIPRHANDGLSLWPQEPYEEGEQEKIAEKIRAELS